MTTAILKDFRRRLNYDSRLTSKAESLKIGRPAIQHTERIAAIAEACLQMSPAPYSSLAIFFCRGLEGSQDGPFACRDSLLTEHAPIPRNRASPGHEDRHLMISFLPALDSPKTGIPKPEPVRRTTIRLRFSYCCVLREHRVNVQEQCPGLDEHL